MQEAKDKIANLNQKNKDLLKYFEDNKNIDITTFKTTFQGVQTKFEQGLTFAQNHVIMSQVYRGPNKAPTVVQEISADLEARLEEKRKQGREQIENMKKAMEEFSKIVEAVDTADSLADFEKIAQEKVALSNANIPTGMQWLSDLGEWARKQTNGGTAGFRNDGRHLKNNVNSYISVMDPVKNLLVNTTATKPSTWMIDRAAFRAELAKVTSAKDELSSSLDKVLDLGLGPVKVKRNQVIFQGNSKGTAFGEQTADYSLQISSLDQMAASGGMAVGTKLTFVFTRKEEARSNIEKANLIQNGANAGQHSFVSLEDMRAKALDVDKLDVTGKWEAAAAIEKVNNALTKVSAQRSRLGASQNRLEHTMNQLAYASENLTASESRIRDADTAKEMMSHVKNNLLTQSKQAMMVQSKQNASQVLALLV